MLIHADAPKQGDASNSGPSEDPTPESSGSGDQASSSSNNSTPAGPGRSSDAVKKQKGQHWNHTSKWAGQIKRNSRFMVHGDRSAEIGMVAELQRRQDYHLVGGGTWEGGA